MAEAKTGTNVGSVVGGALGTYLGGPIGGIAGAQLGGLAGSLISAAPSLVKTESEKYNEEELRKLKRRQELGTLGLTEAEKQQAYTAASGGLMKAGENLRDIQSGLASSLATGAGSALTKSALAEEQLLKQRADVEQEIMKQDLKRKEEELAKIEERTAVSDEYKSPRRGVAANIAMTGIGSLDETIAQLKAARGAGPSPQQIEQFMALTGLDKNQVSAVLGKVASDPTTAGLLSGILGVGQTGIIK